MMPNPQRHSLASRHLLGVHTSNLKRLRFAGLSQNDPAEIPIEGVIPENICNLILEKQLKIR
jgi:hypothetical protein